MRYLILLLVGTMVLSGCGTVFTNFHVESRPEGLEVGLQGYRLLLRDVYQLDVRVRNVGEGILYLLNDHEVLIKTGREFLLDGDVVTITTGEVREVVEVDGQWRLSTSAGKLPDDAPGKRTP